MNRFLLVASILLATNALAAVEPSLKLREDPFWQGPSLELSFTDVTDPDASELSGLFQAEYGWDTGIAVEALVPAILSQSNPIDPAQSAPRIGGAANSRIEVNGLFRTYGDTYDYLALSMGVGLPIQTSTVEKASSTASWLLALAVFGRIDFDWIAVTAKLSDSPSFPTSRNTNSKLGREFLDNSDALSANITAYTYPVNWLAPFFSLTEDFPSAVNISTDEGDGFFTTGENNSGRQEVISVGAEFALKYVPVLFSASFDFIPVSPATSGSETAVTGSARWVF